LLLPLLCWSRREQGLARGWESQQLPSTGTSFPAPKPPPSQRPHPTACSRDSGGLSKGWYPRLVPTAGTHGMAASPAVLSGSIFGSCTYLLLPFPASGPGWISPTGSLIRNKSLRCLNAIQDPQPKSQSGVPPPPSGPLSESGGTAAGQRFAGLERVSAVVGGFVRQ